MDPRALWVQVQEAAGQGAQRCDGSDIAYREVSCLSVLFICAESLCAPVGDTACRSCSSNIWRTQSTGPAPMRKQASSLSGRELANMRSAVRRQ